MNRKIRLLYVYEERIPEALRDLVRSLIPSDFERREMTYKTSLSEQKELFSWCDVVLFAPGRSLPDEVLLAGSGNCKLMQLWSSGFDKFNITGAKAAGIPVANNGGANAISVAEHAVLLMQAVNKRLPDSHRRTTTGQWAGNLHGLDMFMMYRKTVGIIGFGNIGRAVAQRCRGFDMKVVYYDNRRAPPEVEERLDATQVSLDELLSESDIVTLHLHLNDETRHLIDADRIAQMRDGAALINVSRSGLVEREALIDALQSGKLRGAGLDVYDKEPTEAGDPLLELENVVATHHIAGSTYDVYAMAIGAAVDNFRTVMAGEEPRWLVG